MEPKPAQPFGGTEKKPPVSSSTTSGFVKDIIEGRRYLIAHPPGPSEAVQLATEMVELAVTPEEVRAAKLELAKIRLAEAQLRASNRIANQMFYT